MTRIIEGARVFVRPAFRRVAQSRFTKRVAVRLALTWTLWHTRRVVGRSELLPVRTLNVTPIHVWTRSLKSVARDLRRDAELLSTDTSGWETHLTNVRYLAAALLWRMCCKIDTRSTVLFRYANACRRANMRKEAYAVFRRIADSGDSSDPQVTAAANRDAAQEAWARGERESALMYASRLRGSGRNLYAQYSGALSIRDALALIDLGQIEAAQRILAGGLMATGLSKPEASWVSRIYCATAKSKFVEANAGLHPGRERTTVPVILPGFGWSGSGALLDFLKGYNEVDDPLKGRETEMFSGQGGLYTIFQSYDGSWQSRKLLRRFIAHYCFAHIVPGTPIKGRNARGLWARIDAHRRPEFLEALEGFVGRLSVVDRRADRQYIRDTVRGFTRDLIHCLTSRGRYVAFGNCIPAKDVAAVQVFDAPIVIVSWRDCIDAYVSKRLAFPEGSIQINRWMEQAEMRARKYIEGKHTAAPFAAEWLDLRFEDFVRAEKVRISLAETLGLVGGRWSRTFDPEHSSRNIGLEEYLSEREVRQLKEFRAVMSGLFDESREIFPRAGAVRPELVNAGAGF